MMRYAPPNGTAGLALSRVSGSSRDPFPPASTTANSLDMPITPLIGLSLRLGCGVGCDESLTAGLDFNRQGKMSKEQVTNSLLFVSSRVGTRPYDD